MRNSNEKVTENLEKIKNDGKLSDSELCELIGISKPSLYSKKKNHKWKKSEAYMINALVV